MCIVLFSYKTVPGYRLVLAANRDEFTSRPTAPLSWWDGRKEILAGRDLQDGGTWLGATSTGKFGVLTNYREMQRGPTPAASRGEILSHYFDEEITRPTFLAGLRSKPQTYRPYNLLIGDAEGLSYYSNKLDDYFDLAPGIYGLSNHLLDTAWPKVKRGKARFKEVLVNGEISREALFEILADSWRPQESELPDTGIGREWEKKLSSIFISGKEYATRSSAVVTITEGGQVSFCERTYEYDGHCPQTKEERCFTVG